MKDLVSRLLAAIEKTERLAQAATPGPWHVDDERYAEAIYGGETACVIGGGRWGGEASVFDSTEDALHIAHNDPAAVLRRCKADREIVDLHGPTRRTGVCQCCDWVSYPCHTLRALALGYGISVEEETTGE